jgi:repressor LexA
MNKINFNSAEKKQLTERQEQILGFIQDFIQESGYPPTLREIAKEFELSSTFGVKRHLEALEKKGYLSVESNTSRGICLTKNPGESTIQVNSSVISVPIIGRVAAGSPILAIENIEGSLILDPAMVKNSKDAFALKVRGDSMINEGIFDGDIVIVSPSEKGINGDIVVALLEDEATVKKLEIIKNKVRLIPANEKYQPIEVTNLNDFSVAGKVKSVVRIFN